MKSNIAGLYESTPNFPKASVYNNPSKKNNIPVKININQNINPNPSNIVINLTESTESLPSQNNGHGYSNSNSLPYQQCSTQSSLAATDNMRVVIRIRPPLSRETEKNLPFRSIVIVSKENKTCSLIEYIGAESDEAGRQKEWMERPFMFQQHKFTFDEVFDSKSSQEEVYSLTAKPAVQSVLEGYNSTIFAYGQTGTGKTFTMEGFTYDKLDTKRGIIPRTIEDIFSFIESKSNNNTKFIIRAAYLQIYNEMISDLLNPRDNRKNLNIREDRKKGLYVEHLSEFAVRGPNEIYLLLERGASSRAIANTNMNDVSSRSHAVFMIIVEQMITEEQKGGQQITKIGKLNLVDLAGSERTKVTGATGKQLEESKKINKSLSALGNVINALTDPKKRGCHVPYRDSKLTRLLENSLGGNCKTTMIATISPAQVSFTESLSTLNFAKRAKNIKNRPVVNEDIDHNALINKYVNECVRLRAELEEKNKIIASIEPLVVQKKFEEQAKNDALQKYEAVSKQLFVERDEKQKLEMKIKMMNLQMIQGGHKNELLGQLNNSSSNQDMDAKQKFDSENINDQIKDSKAQEEAYKKLLYNQRDVMDGLKSTLLEKENRINQIEKNFENLKKKFISISKLFSRKNQYIKDLENCLDDNKVNFRRQIFPNVNMNINFSLSKDEDNKVYMPYDAEQNENDLDTNANPITLLTSEEKIKELNDLVNYKNNEITLLKRVSEKIFSNAKNNPDSKKEICLNSNLNNNNNNNPVNDKIKQLEEENAALKNQIIEKNQMISLQRQEKDSLEDLYASIVKMNHQTEKENLKLINSKEILISKLGGLIEKIDSSTYSESVFQSLRTDLVKIFQVILKSTNTPNYEDNNEEKTNEMAVEHENLLNEQEKETIDNRRNHVLKARHEKKPSGSSFHQSKKSNSSNHFNDNNYTNNNVIPGTTNNIIKNIKITSVASKL